MNLRPVGKLEKLSTPQRQKTSKIDVSKETYFSQSLLISLQSQYIQWIEEGKLCRNHNEDMAADLSKLRNHKIFEDPNYWCFWHIGDRQNYQLRHNFQNGFKSLFRKMWLLFYYDKGVVSLSIRCHYSWQTSFRGDRPGQTTHV